MQTSNSSVVLAVVQSSSNPEKTYNIVQGGDRNVYCTCPAWRNQRLPVAGRTCKHLTRFHAGQLASKSPVEAKAVAGKQLSTAKAKVEDRKRAHAFHKAMTKGGEQALAAAAEVLTDKAMPSTLRTFAHMVLATQK